MPVKRTEPSRHLLDQAAGFKYTNAASTDLAKRFKAMQHAKARAEKQATKASAKADPRQFGLDLDAPATQTRVVALHRKAGAA